MGTVNVVLGEDTRLNLILGQQLENAVTEVVFDFSAWQTTYGAGTLALSVQRPGDEMPYAVTLTTSGTDATWSVTNLDTAYKGVGHIQLTYTVGTAIKKSVVYKFTVYESLGANGEYPSPGQTWQQNIEAEIGTLSNLPTTDKSSLVASINEIDGDITDVKQDLSTYDVFDSNAITTGKAIKSNGTTTNLTAGFRTEFIPVIDAKKVTVTNNLGSNTYGHAFYDENYDFILFVASYGSGSDGTGGLSFDVPSNARYLIVSGATARVSQVHIYISFDFDKYSNRINHIQDIDNSIEALEDVIFKETSGKYKVQMTRNRYWTTSHSTTYSTKYAYSNSFDVLNRVHIGFDSSDYYINILRWKIVDGELESVGTTGNVTSASVDIDPNDCDVFTFNLRLVESADITSEDVENALSYLTFTEIKIINSLDDCIIERELLENTPATIADLETNNNCYSITNLSDSDITLSEVIAYSTNHTITFALGAGKSVNVFAPDKATRVYISATSASAMTAKVRIKKCDSTKEADIEFRSHLGYMSIAPKNTMSAFRYSALAGFKSLIFSTKRTSDNVWVVCHDATIDATSDGSGTISQMTYSELLAYDFGSWFDSAFANERIPTVDEVLRLCAQFGMTPIVRFDWDNSFGGIYSLIQKHGLVGKAYMHQGSIANVAAFYPTYGNKIKYSVFLSTAPSDADIATMATLNQPIIELLPSIVTDELIEKIYQSDIKAGIYSADTFADILTLINKGVCVFNTDSFAIEGCDYY